MKRFEHKGKNEKRRLLLHKRHDNKGESPKKKSRISFARPSDSKMFVGNVANETTRAPLNKRLIAIALAIVMVFGLIPAGIFMLRPKAAGNGLGPVEMSVRVNGADDFTTAVIPGGEISSTVEEAEYALALPSTILFQKAVIIDQRDNTETEIFSAGTLNNKTYYSFDRNSSAGTAMDVNNQHLVLVLAEKHPVTLNYDNTKGDVDTTAISESGTTFVWGGEGLRVQATPNLDYAVNSITYSVNGGAAKAASVANNAANIPANDITGPITINVNFSQIAAYKIDEVEEMAESIYYPDLDKPNNVSNHGNVADGPDGSLIPTKDNADSVAPGQDTMFFLHSQSSSGGSNFEIANLSINGVNINYPTELYDPRPTTLHEGDYTSVVTVELLSKDTRFAYLSDGSEKHRSLYQITITNVHEDLEVNFYFKESTERNVVLKGLRGIEETGFSVETDASLLNNDYYYTLAKTPTNVFTAAHINSTNNPSANLAVYAVKPGYNPYSAVYELSRDNGPKSYSGIQNNGAIGNPESIILAAGGIFNDPTRYWGKNSSLTNRQERYGQSIFSSGTELMLTTLDATGKDWYGVALTQHTSYNQQLYINTEPYNYLLRLDLGNGGSLENYGTRFDKTGNVLTEKTAQAHTVEDRQAYITLPAETPTNSDQSVVFTGWRVVDANGNPIQVNNNDIVYENLGQIALNATNVGYAFGQNTGTAEDDNQVIALEAVWESLNTADVTTIEVNAWAEVPEGTTGAVAKTITVDDDTVTKYYLNVNSHRETQPVNREAVMLNPPEPNHAEFYEMNTSLSKLSATTQRQTALDQVPENNVYDIYYDLAFNDFTVTKQVLGNPTQLSQGFPITITITKPNGAPLTPAEALDLIEFSNGDKNSATVDGNSITYMKTFGRSDAVTFSNVPHGWTISVSEPKATTSTGGTPDYETTITSKPANAGEQAEEAEGYTGPTTWNGVLNNDTSVTVTNKSESYLILDKNIDRNSSGKYDLTMEAFATGDVLSETKTEKIPTDFVVIVDQSGSMTAKDMAIDPVPANRTVTLEDATSGQYYYYDDATNQYYRVYGKKGSLFQYYPSNSKYVRDVVTESGAGLSWFQSEQAATFDVANQYYYQTQDGAFRPVTVTIDGDFLTYYIRFRYTESGSTTPIYFERPEKPIYKNLLGGANSTYQEGDFGYDAINDVLQAVYRDSTGYTYSQVKIWPFNNSWPLYLDPINTGMYINYPLYKRNIGYTGLYYRDINGVEQVVETMDGFETTEYCDSAKNAMTANTGGTRMNYDNLYVPSDTKRRRDSLEDALNAFAQTVANETDDINGLVDNKVAIVGFSSSGYNNTEVLTGENITIRTNDSNNTSVTDYSYFPYNGPNYTPIPANASNGTNYNGPQYNSETTNTVYQNALVSAAQSMAANEGEDNPVNPGLTKSIKSITALGGTQPEDGFVMARNILDQRQTKTYTKSDGSTVDRNTVVIFFTDGEPGNYDYSDRYKEANDVIKEAATVKGLTNPLGSHPTIYSVGVFDQSDGNPLTYSKYRKRTNSSSTKPTVDRGESTTGMQVEDSDLEYDLTWVDTLKPSSSGYSYYYYLNREWVAGDDTYYGETPNDTIFDYMSVVSSNYPNATGFTSDAWISGTESRSWKTMTDDVRGAQITDENQNPVNNYYRMASNQQTLLDTFTQIATTTLEEITSTSTGLDGTAVLRDVINGNDFKIPEDPSEVFTVTVYTQKGDQDTKPTGNEPASKYIDFHNNDWVEITEDMGLEGQDAADWYANNVKWTVEGGNAYVDVSGFDYGRNYIANGKLPNAMEGTDVNEGKKLIVIVSGLEPKETATGELKSNTTDSGIYKVIGPQDNQTLQMMNAFPVPNLFRYGYNLSETGEVIDDTFNVTLVKGENYTGSDGVMVTYSGGVRATPQALGDSFSWVAQNGSAIYFETFDENAYLNATVSDTGLDQETYDYSVNLIDASSNTPKDFKVGFDIKEDNSTIHVHNESNIRTVVVKEFTHGVDGAADYSSKTKKFPIKMKLTKADGTTLVSDAITGTIIRKDKPDDPKSVNLDFDENNGIVEIELADGDYITFNTLKGYKLIVWEEDGSHDGYIDTYDPDNDGDTIGSGVVVIDANNANNIVEVINTLEENPDVESGVVDSSDPSKILFAILAGMAVLVAIGAGIFLWKKKDVFNEE